MTDSHEARVFTLVVSHLASTPGVGSADLGGPTGVDYLPGQLPAVRLVPDFAGAEREHASDGWVRVRLPFAVEGIVRTSISPTDGNVWSEVLDFRRVVDNAILNNATLKQALFDDFVAHNGGSDGFMRVGPEASQDDWAPPFGRFRRHYQAILHYVEGSL